MSAKISDKISDNVKKSIVVQGSILAIAGIISKIIGFIYRIPMANILGNSGNGIYSISFGIYNIALTLSSYSMPLAVSKLMSERLSKKEYKNAHFLFEKAIIFAFVMGMTACIVLYCGADVLAKLYNTEGLERPLRILAPTTFVVALLGTCRGYFQGHRNMLPTAVSQVLEQIANAIVSVIGAVTCVRICQIEGAEGSYGAMGGTMGTLAGATVALLIMILIFIINRKVISEEVHKEDQRTEESDLVFKAIFLTVLPVMISQSIYQLGYTLDDFTFSNLMHAKGYDSETVSSLQGVFNTQYNQMINLPTAIATSMAAATLPSIVASYTVKDIDRVHNKINQVLKINMFIAIPSAVGLAVLAEPIMTILFPALEAYHNTSVILLETGSLAVVFYALSTMTTSILQGCDKMNVPLRNSGISLMIHGLLIALLLYFTDLGVYALVIGNVTFPMLTCILNSICVKKLVNYKFDVVNSFCKPAIAALIMGIVAFAVYYGIGSLFQDRSIYLTIALFALAMIVSILTYGTAIILLKACSKDEMKSMPIIKKFVR